MPFLFILQKYPAAWQILPGRKRTAFLWPDVILHLTTKKNRARRFLHGDSLGTRTLDPLIKSQLLYQLS